MSNEITDYKLPDTAYMTFDADSLKSLLVQRLTEQGAFTDQIYEGSNLSSFIDVIAYSYHVLMFYLNRTASESVFSEATVYENMNRIVKLLNYKPVGYQTSTLTFKMFASEDLVPGTYTIPKYTFINSNSVVYSTTEDISFTKKTPYDEEIELVGDSFLLYQGEWVEHTPYTSLGTNFENVIITSNSDETKIDHFNMHVYVKHKDSDKYYEYKEVNSLYMYKSDDNVFEKRLNEDLSYELKFGNNITGRRLDEGDIVQVYYIESIGDDGRVGPNYLDQNKLTMYGTTTFNNIKLDTKPINLKYITFDNLETLSMTNETYSTYPQQRETVDDIRRKAPVQFTSQDRLVTMNDYNAFMDKNFDRLLSSSVVVDNNTYLDGHFKYMLEDLGINNPNTESRILFNHLKFASTNTSNNVYIYAVPRLVETTTLLPLTTFLNQSQKRLILSKIEDGRMVGHNPIMMDPVYVAVNFGVRAANEIETLDIMQQTRLEVKRDPGVARDDSAVLDEIIQAISNYFSSENANLGQNIDTGNIGQMLLDLEGVDELYTIRPDTGQRVLGISLCLWNPVYPEQDINMTTQSVKLPFFKFPYLHDPFGLKDKIIFVD